MKSSVKVAIGFLALAIALIGCSQGGSGVASPPPGVVIYDAIPGLLPPDMWSVGFQETWTREFGDYIHLAGANRALKSVTVTMSDRALSATTLVPSDGWSYPITLNIYDAIPGEPFNTVGALLGTVTQTFTIPWRPAEDLSCPIFDGRHGWRASDGTIYNGLAFNITFDFASQKITLPDAVIVGIAYNTQSWGVAKTGVPGPYNSLNVGAEGSATVGTDDNIDRVFWNTSIWHDDHGLWELDISSYEHTYLWGPSPPAQRTIPIQITAAP